MCSFKGNNMKSGNYSNILFPKLPRKPRLSKIKPKPALEKQFTDYLLTTTTTNNIFRATDLEDCDQCLQREKSDRVISKRFNLA